MSSSGPVGPDVTEGTARVDLPVGSGRTTALLGLLQITIETGLYLGLAAGVARAGSWFRKLRIRRRLEAVSGTVLIGLGLRVAASP